jgi:hypothetical protein
MLAFMLNGSAEKGAEAPQSVFVGQHQRHDRCGRVARSNVQLQLVGLLSDYDFEKDLLGLACLANSQFGHGRNVMTDAGDILAGLAQRLLDDRPYRRGAGKVMFPMLADGVGLAEVHKNAVVDSLGAGVGIDRFPERIFIRHDLCRSARGACVTSSDFIAYCRLAISSPTRKSKR